MNLETEINNKGFVFGKIHLDEREHMEVLAFPEPSDYLQGLFLRIIRRFDPSVSSIHCVYEDIRKGMYHEMHTHLTPSRYQALIWFPCDDFLGRDFLYGTKTEIKRFHPTVEDICFMKTNDLSFIHGVAPLESDTLVRTLLISVDHATNLGEHLTIAAKDLSSI